ncbi:MAG: hypothetical protein R6V04_06690 [bacterium]
MKLKSLYFTVVFVFFIGSFVKLSAQKYDFNNGTKQGWTMDGAYDENGNGPYSSNFFYMWKSDVDYPYAPGKFTGGTQCGSLALGNITMNHGVTGSSGQYWTMIFHSPDLSSIQGWQNASGYTVKIADCLGPSKVYASLQVKIWDKSQNQYRYFTSGSAQELNYDTYGDNNAVWNSISFDWSSLSTFPSSDYTVNEIFIKIWGHIAGLYEGGVYIDAIQAITSQTSESITVDIPNGKETWYAGTKHYITWHTSKFNDPVKIEYSTDNGYSYSTIISSTANDGSYEWTVPQDFSSQCLVRISDAADGSPSDISDAVFTIDAFIELDVPDGGEDWAAGTTHYIVWHGQGIDNYDVKMEYSTDNGANYTFINYKTNIGLSGSYAWTVPNTPSTQCLIRVTVTLPPDISDVSSSVFTISSAGGTNTQTGNNVKVSLSNDVHVTFDNVTGAGNTTLNTKVSGPAPPGGLSIVPSASPVYYDISTTATFSGKAKICIHYDDTGMTQAQESALKLQVYESPSGPWNDITTSVNVVKDSICGEVTHFSDFAVMSSGSNSDTLSMSLDQGWNWISFNVQPTDLSIDKVMENFSNLVIAVNGDGEFYIPGSVNTIGQIDLTEGYKVYTSAQEEFSITGEQVSVTTPIILDAGWNFISYLMDREVTVEGALDYMLPDLVIIKNDDGEFFIPNSVNTLGTMRPGEGYYLYMNAPDTLKYEYFYLIKQN